MDAKTSSRYYHLREEFIVYSPLIREIGMDAKTSSRYHLLREQWTHEDNLINHRITWLLMSQGLLFTAYGSFMAAVDKETPYADVIKLLIALFPFLGISLSGLVWFSINAAIKSMDAISVRYDKWNIPDEEMPLTPSTAYISQGRTPSELIPLLFIVCWLIVFIALIIALNVKLLAFN